MIAIGFGDALEAHGSVLVSFEFDDLFLTTGILGHVSQISTQRISLYIFHTIKSS